MINTLFVFLEHFEVRFIPKGEKRLKWESIIFTSYLYFFYQSVRSAKNINACSMNRLKTKFCPFVVEKKYFQLQI